MQRERAELEQNFAREISNLVQRLSAEKDQLEAELKLKLDQEVLLVRWVVTSQLALCCYCAGYPACSGARLQHRLFPIILQPAGSVSSYVRCR